MKERQRDVHQAGTPRRCPVRHAVLGLHRQGSAAQASGESTQQVRSDRGVRIDNRDSIRDPVLQRTLEGVLQRITFASS